MGKRKVCIFTGTRAEYGLLKPLMDKIKSDPDLELQIVASCMHLSPEFGLTYQEIEKDGFNIDEKVEMLLSSDTPSGIVKSMGLGMIGYTDALNRLKPDITVVLGDRFEALAFAIASFVNRIPIAHISGGEITEGTLDDAFRHAITKLSYLHLTSTEEYRKRVIQLGEEPERVFNVGEIGLYDIFDNLLSKKEVEELIKFKLDGKVIMVTYHPVTLNTGYGINDFNEILLALEKFNDLKIIFTKANADCGGNDINKMIDDFVKRNKNSIVFQSMGRKLYLSTLQYVDMVVGNSSSGIVEAPCFKKPTINIGDRQKGRLRAKSVIDVPPNKDKIKEAINFVYSSSEFQNELSNVVNPYYKENGIFELIKVIKNVNLERLIVKKFYDLKFRD
jgi:UDP-hydrolysing UDP-N-acetyl-D-glucosamine 2-epimerase